MLRAKIHKGDSNAIHGQVVMTSNRTTAHANPKKATQRGRIAVRSTIMLVEKMNTPAILMAKTFKNAPISCRAR